MRKKTTIAWWILLLLSIPIIYLMLQLFIIMYRSYETDTIVEDTMADSIVCRGILGMSETEILYDGGGVLGYTVENGARVSEGTVIAEAFSTIAQAQQSAYARQLNEEIEVLQKSQISTTGTDTEMLLSQTYKSLNDYLDVASRNNYASLHETILNLQLSANKTQIVVGAQTDFAQRIEMLTAQRDVAIQAATGTGITTPVSGYFVSATDSRQRLYTTQNLQEMTPADLYTAAQIDSPKNPTNVAGKVIEDYRWSFFASVDLQQAAKFTVGSRVYISFTDSQSSEVPATVQSIEIDEEAGVAKVELFCNYINSDVVKMEHATATIRFRNYTGLRIDKRALRVVNGVNGVYVLTGSTVNFRRINIIYEDENYLLVPLQSTTGENEVKRFDEAIVSGRELYDGKLINA